MDPAAKYFTQDSAGVGSNVERGDFFGKALVAGDFNNDAYADLVVGAPGESTDSFAVGAVNVLYGSASGLSGSGSQTVTQNSYGVRDNAEGSDALGGALAAGDFDNDGFDELAIGVPQESIGSIGWAGAVNVLHGSASGLSGSGSQTFTQNSYGVRDSAEGSDSFGGALTAGDFDNDGFAELAIGVPQETLGSIDAAGAVNVLYGRAEGLRGSGSQFFTQNSPRVGSVAELFDEFGSALAAGDFDNDGFDELAIGVPRESSRLTSVGAVNVLYGRSTGLTGRSYQYFTQNSPGVWNTAESLDLFGGALAAGDFDNDGFDELAIGVRLEDISNTPLDAGAVNVLPGGTTGLSGRGSQYFTPNSPGVGPGAKEPRQFGAALTATGP